MLQRAIETVAPERKAGAVSSSRYLGREGRRCLTGARIFAKDGVNMVRRGHMPSVAIVAERSPIVC